MEECYIIRKGEFYDGFEIKDTVFTDPDKAIKEVLFLVNESDLDYKKDDDDDDCLISYSCGNYYIDALIRKLK